LSVTSIHEYDVQNNGGWLKAVFLNMHNIAVNQYQKL